MKTALKSILLTVAFVGTGIKAEVAARAETPVWNNFAIAWEKRVAADAALAQAWQEVQLTYQQIAKTPYEASEMYRAFGFYTECIRQFEAIVQEISESSNEEVVSWLKKINLEVNSLNDPREYKGISCVLNNCPPADMLLTMFYDLVFRIDEDVDGVITIEKPT